MTIRLLTDEERIMAVALWQYCFADKQSFTEWYFKRRAGDVYAEMEGDRLVAQIVFVPLTLSVRGAVRSATMLSGIATAADRRGQGHMTVLMKEGLAYQRAEGAAAAVLYPVDYGLYGRYGFARCGEIARVRTELDRLPACQTCGEIILLRKGDIEDCESLMRAYEASFALYSGHTRRDRAAFTLLLEELETDDGYAAVYRRDGKEEGYLLYHMQDETMYIGEIGASGNVAREELLNFLRGHSSSMSFVEFTCPLEDPLWQLLPDPRGTVFAEPYDMFRLLDIQKAMNGLPAGMGEAILCVRDGILPWNEGVWRFYEKNGLLETERVADQQAPEVTIGELTQWAFGCVSGSGLVERGAALPEALAKDMDGLLPRKPFFIYEMY